MLCKTSVTWLISLLAIAGLAIGGLATGSHAATVSLEIATAPGVQPTAHHQWLQLLAKVGVNRVRVRGGKAGDKPDIATLSPETYHVVGVLISDNKLLLPAGSFGRRDTGRLRDYFDRLLKDGPDRQTEAIGNFGLTRQEFEAVFGDLGGPTLFPTKGLTVEQLLAQANKSLKFKIAYAPTTIPAQVSNPARTSNRPQTSKRLAARQPLDTELSQLTIGTAMAIALRSEGKILVPEKPRGKAIQYRVTRLEKNAEAWPVGYKPDARSSEVSPEIMEFTNVEIDGFTLAEVVDVIGPRLKIPVVWDTATLAQHKIEPAKINVRLPSSRRTYKSILRKLLSQGRLKGELRVDEVGTAFYWITR